MASSSETSIRLLKAVEGYRAGFDSLQGLGEQSSPCFDYFKKPGCNTSIPDVFTTPYRGPNQNKPDTKVYLFTTANQNKAELLHRCGGKLPPDTTFNPQEETVIIIHGYGDGVCRTAWMREMKVQLFKRSNYNIILIDWTWGNFIDILSAGYNSVVTGQQVGFVVKNIMKKYHLNGEKFHVIGHSFGSIAGSFGAKYIQKWRKKNTIRRLTVLDNPVVPFRKLTKNGNIHYTDAKFVDVYHTSAGHCFPFSIGLDEVLGHIDFYPNGGKYLNIPPCLSYAIHPSILKGDILYAALSFLLLPLCAHLQSIQYFKISINPPTGLYVGVPCDSYEDFVSGACTRCCREHGKNCSVAGMDAEYYFPYKSEPRKPRKYYFQTSDFCPFDEDYEFSIYKDCQDKIENSQRCT